MKTRKVGRVLSVLLAIVMVVGLMIPASSVLADTVTEAAYADVNWKDENTVAQVANHAQLKDALKNAPTDGTVKYINITADIKVPKFATSSDGYYLGTVLYLEDFFYAADGGAWVTPYMQKNPTAEKTDTVYDRNVMHDLIFASDSQVAKEWVKRHKSGPLSFMSTNTDFSEPHYFTITDTDDYQFAVQMFKMNPAPEDLDLFGVSTDESGNIVYGTGQSWESTALIVFPNTNVVINFNGKKVSLVEDYYGTGNSAFKGDPALMSSVFTVFGDLTILGNGTITGGTGYIMDFKTTSQAHAYTNYTAHALDWSAVEKKTQAQHENPFTPIQSNSTKPYLTKWSRANYYGKSSTGAHGGGVYVAPKASFTMYSGTITGNCTWMDNKNPMFKSDTAISQGAGVYVAENAAFNMYGGEISNNASRAYSKVGNSSLDTYEALAQGGGVYLAPQVTEKTTNANGETITKVVSEGAKMNFTGGKVCDNGSYAETNKQKNIRSEGAGIYVGTGAVLNMLGSADVTTNIENDLANFPQVVGNTCGAITRAKSDALYVKGAGIYADGTVNIRRAVVASNDFSELARDNDEKKNGTDFITQVPSGTDMVCVVRDKETGLAMPDDNGNVITSPTSYDVANELNGWTSSDSDKIIKHETSAKFGVYRAYSSTKINSSGAGIYVGSNATINLGDRTWVYDNYDLLTNGHKAFGDIRSYKRTIAAKDSDGNVPYGGYTYSLPDQTTENKIQVGTNGDTIIYQKPGDGRTWSDTRDDIYLPDGKAMHVAESLFECKIGVNYYNMVGPGAKPEEKAQKPLGANSNRVFVVSSNNLDYDVWGTTSATPRPRDIQFFYLNDNNKEWENANYQMPSRVKSNYGGTKCGVGATFDYDLHYSKKGAIADVASSKDTKKGYAPYEGYVVYETAVSGLWFDSVLGPGENWKPYNGPACYERVTGSASAPIYPQVSTELSTTSADVINNSANKAKYMDYKVIWDDDATNGFATGANQPVLRFGTAEDRKMYVTVDFSEANKTYFAINKNQTIQASNTVDSYSTKLQKYTTVNGVTFDADADNPAYNGTIEIGIPVPDYNIYKDGLLEKLNKTAAGAITSITDEKGNLITTADAKEAPDLYFKNWSFYTSYGYGPDTCIPDTKAQEVFKKVDNDEKFMLTRGTFTIDLSRINNTNLNAQPCPTLTAMWYSREELNEARYDLSSVKAQVVIDGAGYVYIRLISLIGGYIDSNKEIMPTKNNDGTLYFNDPSFIVSKTNATPTIEGGYQKSTLKRSGMVYKKIIMRDTSSGKEKVYNTADIASLGWTDFTHHKNDNATGQALSFMYTDMRIGHISEIYKTFDADSPEFNDAAKTVWYVTPSAEVEDWSPGKRGEHDKYYYGKSRAFSLAALMKADKDELGIDYPNPNAYPKLETTAE